MKVATAFVIVGVILVIAGVSFLNWRVGLIVAGVILVLPGATLINVDTNKTDKKPPEVT